MNKDNLIRLVNNPKFISGIHNYCDRWCERCTMTSRCANYAMGEGESACAKEHDLNNEEFWDRLHEAFQLTCELLQDSAEEMGIDLDAPLPDEYEEQQRKLKQEVKANPCVQLARNYAKEAKAWFDDRQELLDREFDDLGKVADMDLPENHAIADAHIMSDAIEVIRFHQHQIFVKLSRAAGSQSRAGGEMEHCISDANGSAKVALIGLDRSIVGWATLHANLKDDEDSILGLLAMLTRLRNGTEMHFPDARSFQRPGFD